MKKGRLYLFSLLLVVGILTVLFLGQINRDKIKTQFEEITIAEGTTIRSLVQVAGTYLAEEGQDALTPFLRRLYENPGIVYAGLFKNDRLIFLESRYEGYFPSVPGGGDFRFLQSPIGRLFDVGATFQDRQKNRYLVHLGFDYDFLTRFENDARRNFLVIAGLFVFVILVVVGLVVYFDRRFFQKELELERERQEKERFKELALLTAEIAHEIKNPLNSLYLSFNALGPYLRPGEEARFYKEAIKGEVKRIDAIIRSYSDLSKEIRPRPTSVDLNGFVDRFRLLLAEELKSKGANLEVHLAPGASWHTDADLLQQVLLNLVKNALEAGAGKLELTFNDMAGRALEITLEDNGRGIDPAAAGEIFKPYVSGKTKGTGLGLYIVFKITGALNGEVCLESHQPGNTVFKITLKEEKKR